MRVKNNVSLTSSSGQNAIVLPRPTPSLVPHSKHPQPLDTCFDGEETKSGRIALLWWFGLMAFLIGISFLLNFALGQVVALWWFLSSLCYLVVWPMRENRSLQPLNFSVTSNSELHQKQQHLRKTLARANKLLGVQEPAVLLGTPADTRLL